MLAHVAVHAPHPNDRNQMSGFWGRNLSSQMNTQGSDGLKHFVHVAVIIVLHAHAAPFLHEHAFGINEESAAFNAFYLAAIHDFVFDHAEHMAHFLFGIGNQLEEQFQLGLEGVVRFHVVAADAENGGARQRDRKSVV